MSKDIIYIDTEDDVTTIIGKIKASKEKAISLVPPKRSGLLQSAVNLRLFGRIAEKEDKQLAVITNNKALIALSAAAKIPVAKNLQSKPEIAEIPALEVDDGEDIIEGSELSIGELAKTADRAKDDDIEDDIGKLDIDNENQQFVPVSVSNPTKAKTSKPVGKKAKSGTKVPDFLKFRKKLFLAIAGGVLLIIFLIWAIWFAPAAKIIVNTKMTAEPISMTLNLVGTAATNVDKNNIQTVTKQTKNNLSVNFTATGKQKLGEKATGTITLSNSDSTLSKSVPAGSIFSNGGYGFVTTTTVTVPGYTDPGGGQPIIPGVRNVSVTASAIGAAYNLPAGAYSSSISGLSANGGQMSGGSSRDAIVVTADDIQKASQALVDLPTDSYKQQLNKQFTNDEKVISDSFSVDRTTAVSVPAVGAESTDGKATLTSPTTFSLTAIAKTELETFLRNELNKQIANDKTQRIYNDGIDKIKIDGYQKTDKGATANIATVGHIGPNINKDTVINKSKGKRYGDVQAALEGINGVSSVDVKFPYFWVTTVPNDVNKIDVEFALKND
jgi:hypothetical protein